MEASRISLPAGSGRTASELQLLDRLMSDGLLEAQDCLSVQKANAQTGIGFCAILIERGLVPERTLLSLVAAHLDLPCVQTGDYPDVPLLEDEVSAAFLKRRLVLPIALDDDSITLATADPYDPFIVNAFRLLTGKRVALMVAVPSELEEVIQRLYGAGRSRLDEIVQGIDGESPVDEPDAQRLSDMAAEAPVVRLVNLIIARSIDAGASDIHFEVYERKLLIRHRIDGVLHDLETPPQHAAPAITSRIKIMAKLNIAERRLPQDGRIRLTVRGKIVDFRISIVPTLHGERIVMRVLDRGSTPKSLEDLGLNKAALERVQQVLSRPNGMFLVTGPTGSGKTTTLYAALLTLPSHEKNILTVEDPIEYQVSNVNQIQVKPQIGLTFANILRSVLRQDPDIILVGEIRDQETADISVHAALTGHLVLSTLHTNTAAGAMARLLDMGVEDYLLTTALEGVMAQRLVRKLCLACRRPHELGAETIAELDLRRLAPDGPITFYQPVGCLKCNNTGYSGRTTIVELLLPNEAIRTLVMKHAPAQEIQAAAIAAGMTPMLDDGLSKVLAGITSLEEVKQAVADLH